jgi:hypothetical protein
MADTNSRLAGYIPSWPLAIPSDPTSQLSQLYRCYQTAGAVLQEWPSAEMKVARDTMLSQVGKAAALASAVSDFQTRLNRAMTAVLWAKTFLNPHLVLHFDRRARRTMES